MHMKKKLITMATLFTVATAGILSGCNSNTPSSTNPPATTSGGTDTQAASGGTDTQAASGGTETQPAANSGDLTTLQVYLLGVESAGQAGVLKAVNEKLVADGLNINVKVSYFDDYWNQLTLSVAGGTVIDLAWSHANELGNLVRKGAYQPIDDALANYGQDLLAKTPQFLLLGGQVNGKQYAMPRVSPMSYNRNVLNLRGDLREKYGLSEIKTVADLEAYFEAVQTNDPDIFPVLGWMPETLYPALCNNQFPIDWFMMVDPEDPTHEVKSFFHSSEAEEVFATVWKWSQNNWIRKDTSSIDSGDAGFDYGLVACVNANAVRAAERINQFSTNFEGGKIDSVVLQPEKSWIFFAGDNQLAVPSTSKNANEAVAFVNWMKSSQENFDLWTYGVKDVNYKLVDGAVDTSGIDAANNYSVTSWMWDDIDLVRFSSYFPKEDAEALKTWDANSTESPYLGFVMDQSPVSTQMAQLWAIFNEYVGPWATGVTDFSTQRDEFLKKLESAGIQEVRDECQKQLDAFLANR